MFSSTKINVNMLSLRHAKGLKTCGGGGMSGQSVADQSWHPSHASTEAITNNIQSFSQLLTTCISSKDAEHAMACVAVVYAVD